MFYCAQDVFDWLNAAKAEHTAAKTDMEKARKYYENKQVPADVPDDLSYIVNNMCKPHVDLQVSKVIGGKIDFTLFGPENVTPPQRHLLEDVLDYNHFRSGLLPVAENQRQVEGLTGWRVYYDPLEDGPHGLGAVRLINLDPLKGEILLDPNATNGAHMDDRARASKCPIPLKEAQRNPDWAHAKDALSASSYPGEAPYRSIDLVDIYDVEFEVVFYIKAIYDPERKSYMPLQRFVSVAEPGFEDRIGAKKPENADDGEDPEFLGDFEVIPEAVERAQSLQMRQAGAAPQMEQLFENAVTVKLKVYFGCKVIDEDTMLEPPRPTGYSGFTIIEGQHTPRSYTHKYPASQMVYLTDIQDRLNGTAAMIFEAAKKGIKNAILVKGASYQEFARMRRKIAGVGDMFFIDSPNAEIAPLPSATVPPILMQQYQLDREAFDLAGQTSEPDRGQDVDLSGKAIVNLQARADIPVFVQNQMLEYSLSRVFQRILESFEQLDKPFVIRRKIDGQVRNIYYNYPLADIQEELSEEENFIHEEIVNPLLHMKATKVKVKIDTNTIQREQVELEKAFAMFGQGQLHPQHLHKAVFPDKWAETFEQAQQWNGAMQVAETITKLSPIGQQSVQNALSEAVQADQLLATMGNKNGANR